MFIKKPKKVVVIGGGTGTYTVLSGLKKYPPDVIDLAAVVTVADSGGSTGRLRDEFGYLPVGDFRMALVALADDRDTGHLLRNLFLHRFNKGRGLEGHNFGNLFLVAMTDILGSEEAAIEFTSRVLRVRGKVVPVSRQNLTLVARYDNGTIIRGEASIDEPPQDHDGKQRITDLWLEPESIISPKAKQAILEADLIVLGPGDLYTSILANIVVADVASTIEQSKAKILYTVNLMTKYGQTHAFTTTNHLEEIVRYVGKSPHYVLINNIQLPEEIIKKYHEQHEFPVEDDLAKTKDFRIIRKDLLASEEVVRPSGDILKRSLIRHDSGKLAKAIMSLL